MPRLTGGHGYGSTGSRPTPWLWPCFCGAWTRHRLRFESRRIKCFKYKRGKRHRSQTLNRNTSNLNGWKCPIFSRGQWSEQQTEGPWGGGVLWRQNCSTEKTGFESEFWFNDRHQKIELFLCRTTILILYPTSHKQTINLNLTRLKSVSSSFNRFFFFFFKQICFQY